MRLYGNQRLKACRGDDFAPLRHAASAELRWRWTLKVLWAGLLHEWRKIPVAVRRVNAAKTAPRFDAV